MRRFVLVVAGLALLAGAALAVALLRRHHSDPVVATVGGRPVTRERLDLMVEHFHEEAEREGRPFPDPSSHGYGIVRKQALALLVDRAKLETAAARLGIHVSDDQVERRLHASGSEEDEGGAGTEVDAEAEFERSTVRSQLILEAVFRKLTSGLRVPAAAVRRYYRSHRTLYGRLSYARVAPEIRRQLIGARRNAVVAAWVSRARRTVPVEIRDHSLR